MNADRRKLIALSAVPLALGLAAASRNSQAQSGTFGLPGLTIELGNSAQANGGRGIDQGTYYQLDCSIGTTAFNGFSYTANSDGTITLGQSGVYQISAYAHVVNPTAGDIFQIPAQVTFAIGQSYPWPGIYQYSVQSFPSPIVATQSAQNLGSISLNGKVPLGWNTTSPVWLGFSKVLGTQYQTALALQGALTILKIG
jgi:hypothetical protein